MADYDDLHPYLHDIVEPLLGASKRRVRITNQASGRDQLYLVEVPSDVVRFAVGAGGRTAQAIRMLARTAARQLGLGAVNVQIRSM